MILSTVNLKRELCDKIEKSTGETLIECGNSKNASAEMLSQAEIILTMGDFSKEMLNKSAKLKWLFVMSAGVDALPFEELSKANVLVSNVSGIHATQMAEQTLGEMIIFSRRLHICRKNQQLKKWDRNLGADELLGKTLLIIGAGNVGREIARKAKAFDMRVLGLKKHTEPLPNFDEVWNMGKFSDALAEADFTVLVTPLTPETYHLIGKREFEIMKHGSIFINISRGANVDEQALIETLQSGHLGGAAIDVFHNEPLEPESPLWDMENVLVTPHLSGLSPYYFTRSSEYFIKSYKLYREGKELPNLVSLTERY